MGLMKLAINGVEPKVAPEPTGKISKQAPHAEPKYNHDGPNQQHEPQIKYEVIAVARQDHEYNLKQILEKF